VINLSNIDKITSAKYGANGTFNDVTSLLIQGYLTVQGTLNIEVNNATMGGDPTPMVAKTLQLQYTSRPGPTSDDAPMGPPGGETSQHHPHEIRQSNPVQAKPPHNHQPRVPLQHQHQYQQQEEHQQLP